MSQNTSKFLMVVLLGLFVMTAVGCKVDAKAGDGGAKLKVDTKD
jgi:hypothetical protein